MKNVFRLVSSAAALSAAPLLHAIDAGPVAFRGSISATAASSEEYNYLGKTEGTLDLNIVEVILNGSHRFDNGLRATAQLYSYKLDDYKDLTLDFAVLDYSFGEVFGVRAGRLKRPVGLYGDAQDIDVVRPFAFLPLDFYPKGLRTLLAAVDGVGAYGTVKAGKLGSFEYQLIGGWLPPAKSDAPFLADVGESTPFRIEKVDPDKTMALALFWNTPVEGLKVGYTLANSFDIGFSGSVKTAAELSLATSDARLAPLALGSLWDVVLANKAVSQQIDSRRDIFSAEYTRGDWTFAAEYQIAKNTSSLSGALGQSSSSSKSESYYVMATWQANDRLQLGAYYAEGYANKDDHDGRRLRSIPSHYAYQKDATVAASYALTSWWLVKGEVHLIDGTRGLNAALNGDAAKWNDSRWAYYVLKSTISF